MTIAPLKKVSLSSYLCVIYRQKAMRQKTPGKREGQHQATWVFIQLLPDGEIFAKDSLNRFKTSF